MKMRNDRKYMICEAPVCVGAPTVGMETAYAALKDTLSQVFGEKAEFSDFEGPRTVPHLLCDKRLIGLETVMHVSRQLRKKFLCAFDNGYTPIALGGDHSVVMGSLAAVGEVFGAENTALIYIDGHSDINTENTTLSGRLHGVPLAAAMGICNPLLDAGKNRVDLYGKNTYIVGAHSIDPDEWGIMEREGVTLYSPHSVRRRGYDSILREILDATKGKAIHVSFDVDVIDGSEFFATGYAMPGGLPFDTVLGMMRYLALNSDFVSFDCVEYNPLKDKNNVCLNKLRRIFEVFV